MKSCLRKLSGRETRSMMDCACSHGSGAVAARAGMPSDRPTAAGSAFIRLRRWVLIVMRCSLFVRIIELAEEDFRRRWFCGVAEIRDGIDAGFNQVVPMVVGVV